MVRKLLATATLATMGLLGVQVGPASAVGTTRHECRARAHENYRTRVNNGQDRATARRHLRADLQRCNRRFG
ncbi:MAG: hypothetical protein JOZ37_04470 [Actinobacteria bacterium]|nr:hypothetical protein [Actinomycetota bacterium]MBV8957593.1 hypothetical protein [Actinomycetota bacterium]MBV9254758.1 hypothetical protein [Actinomycetota bacterium]MBV9663201.1 hypothetical protein [Actinomycetota bacterium]MBV9935591.1 hypothetical protein [Actinomycetota bacterium]